MNMREWRKHCFAPPTVADVEAYCSERGNGIDAQRFVDFHATRGWMAGKAKVKDWRACVRTWEGRNAKSPVQRQDDPGSDSPECVGPVFVLKGGASWRATKAQLATWANAFPAIDQAQELAKAAAWCASNPGKGKTAKGMPRFLNSWLSRAAERQMSNSGPALIEHLPTAAEVFALFDEDPAHV
jgi:hypothetical protein